MELISIFWVASSPKKQKIKSRFIHINTEQVQAADDSAEEGRESRRDQTDGDGKIVYWNRREIVVKLTDIISKINFYEILLFICSALLHFLSLSFYYIQFIAGRFICIICNPYCFHHQIITSQSSLRISL